MNELIKIEKSSVGGDLIDTVNARELHGFLDVQTRYNDWIKNRIEQYGFGEGTDFLTLTENLVSGGTQKTHHVTVDMAKELAMVERNDKGREARKYFIECERRAKANVIDLTTALADPAKLRTALLAYTEKVMVLCAKPVKLAWGV